MYAVKGVLVLLITCDHALATLIINQEGVDFFWITFPWAEVECCIRVPSLKTDAYAQGFSLWLRPWAFVKMADIEKSRRWQVWILTGT